MPTLRFRAAWTRVPSACFAVLLLLPLPSRAQLALPGAVAPSPEGSVVAPSAPAPRRRASAAPAAAVPAHPRAAATTPISSLAGKTLLLNGGASQIAFEPRDKTVDVARLTLSGESIGDARQTCRVEAPGVPIAVTPAGRPDGVERVRIEFPACPLQFDVLDGAVLVDRTQGACEFKDAQCRFDPVGLWGPSSGDIGPERVKAIDRERAGAEASIRAAYKALVASTKDRVAITGYARDQAQFSSTREELCRDYVGEGRHGFCAAKLAEARAAFLAATLDTALDAKAERRKERAARRQGRS